jgi:hypothetical protein
MTKILRGTIVAGTSILSSIGIFFAACESTPPPVGAGGTSGGGKGGLEIKLDGSLPGQGGSGGSGATTGVPPTGDANCGSQTSSTTRQPADILLVLDRSGSMDFSTTDDTNCRSSPTSCTARWPALTAAVSTTLTNTAGSISWGLKLFSSSGSACGVNNGVEVAISATSVPAIQAKVDTTTPGGNTPTAQAVTAATAYLKTVNDQNSKYILLATDGEPNCAANGSSEPNVPATIDAITAAKSAGFLVYVIGIGPSVGNLDNFAEFGGTTNYFPASSPQALTAAFAAISKAVTTCTFALAQTPPDVNNIAVYLDGKIAAKDPVNGWSLGGNSQTVVLNGTTCDLITSGAATQVKVLFGCPGGPPPPDILY